jgi:hypothetical protein
MPTAAPHPSLIDRGGPTGLEPADQAVEQATTSTSKSAVSRRFAAATETALGELMSRRLDDLDLAAFMADEVHFGEHTCVVALGIGIDGTKYPLAIEEARGHLYTTTGAATHLAAQMAELPGEANRTSPPSG